MAYDLNGSNQRLTCSSAVVTAAPLTMAAWFNADSAANAGVLVSITNGGTAGNVTRFGLLARGDVAGDPVEAIISDTSATVSARTTTGYTTGTWHHACGVFASSTSRTAYIDGGSSATNTTSVVPSLLEVTSIGVQFLQAAGGTSGVTYFDGRIAEVGIWNTDLTAAEIASLADGMTCDKVRPQSLVFYAPLVRELIDARGGLTITNNNTATVAAHTRVYS
jgi:hypothetical protein